MKILVVCALAVLLAGCSSAKNDDAGSVIVWHWASDRDEVFRELAGRFENETGIKVKFELFAPSDIYQQRIKNSAQTGTLPDIYGVLGEKNDFASYIRAGLVKNLNAEMVSWKDAFIEKALAVNEFKPGNEFGIEPGIYGVPLDGSVILMLYNRKIYGKAGLDPDRPPTGWAEFVEHNRLLRSRGLPGFVSGFGELWMIQALASNYAMNIMGEEKVYDTHRGKVPYTDPDWIRVFRLFKQMADEGILVEGAVTMVNKMAEQTFVNERATYAFNGSWSVNVYKGMNPDLDYGVFLPPAASAEHPMRVWGGAGTSFVVNSRSEKQEDAVKFLRWLTAEEQQSHLARATEGLPSVRASLRSIPPALEPFAAHMGSAIHPNGYPAHEHPAVLEAFGKGIQAILIGEATPEGAAREVQRIKEKVIREKE